MKKIAIVSAAVCLLAGLTACTTTEQYTATGAAIGVGTGALVGDTTGAIVGGVLGAGVGNIIGRDQEQKQNYHYQRHHQYHHYNHYRHQNF